MKQRKLGRPTDQRLALLRNQVSQLLWHGRIETTLPRAKEVSRIAEKILTKAMNTYKDTEKKIVTRKNAKGQDVKVELINDGAKKLAARRAIIAKLYNIPEAKMENESKAQYKGRTEHIKNPLVEKIFNVLAPKYDQRSEEVGQKGGYTRVLKLGMRRGDNAEMAIIELI